MTLLGQICIGKGIIIWSLICVFILAPYCIHNIVDVVDYQIYLHRVVGWNDYDDWVISGCKVIAHFILWCIIWVL